MQKLKSFFTLLGVCIGVMFLIAVISIVDGMGRYMETQLVGKLIALNSFELRTRPNINMGDVDRATWMEYNRRPRILESDVQPVVDGAARGDALGDVRRGQRQDRVGVLGGRATVGERDGHRRRLLRHQEAGRHRRAASSRARNSPWARRS